MLLVLSDEAVAVVVVMMAGAAAVRSFCARHMLNACSPGMVATRSSWSLPRQRIYPRKLLAAEQ